MNSGATFSPDRAYRYHLWRAWDAPYTHRCVFIGVNPSTAGETDNDHTISKEVGFAKRWGFGGIDKVNLFGLVSTDVTGLLRAEDPVGPENDEHLRAVCESASRIVLAWGSHKPKVRALVKARLKQLAWIYSARSEIVTFGYNDDGTPKHPLMLAYTTPVVAHENDRGGLS